MSTDIDARQLNAFVDGELALAEQLALEARLATDPALQSRVEALRALRDAVRERADYHALPADLWADVAAAVPVARPPAGRRWLAWRPIAWTLTPAMLLVALVLGVLQPVWRDARLQDEVIAGHVRATLSQRLVDVASSDQHTVKPWLSSRLDYSPPVHEPALPGVEFLGGRVDYLDGRPVAALVYRERRHLVDVFVWPTGAADSAPRMTSERGFQVARWSQRGMAHWAVSDLNGEELASLVREIADRK